MKLLHLSSRHRVTKDKLELVIKRSKANSTSFSDRRHREITENVGRGSWNMGNSEDGREGEGTITTSWDSPDPLEV